jgi:hypothetical protein
MSLKKKCKCSSFRKKFSESHLGRKNVTNPIKLASRKLRKKKTLRSLPVPQEKKKYEDTRHNYFRKINALTLKNQKLATRESRRSTNGSKKIGGGSHSSFPQKKRSKIGTSEKRNITI